MCKGCGGGRATPFSPAIVPEVKVGDAPLVLLQGVEIDSVAYGAFTGTRYIVSDEMYVDLRDVPSLLKSGKVTNVPTPSHPSKL